MRPKVHRIVRLKSLSLAAAAIIAALVTILDQITKFMIVRSFAPPPGVDPASWNPEPITLIPGFLQIIYRTNTGAAWSTFQDKTLHLAVFSTFVAGAIAVWAWRLKPEELILRGPLALILGGAVGNLIDRFRLGHVTDFIDAHWRHESHFPTFNVADSGICVGMGLLILLTFTARPHADSASADLSGNNPG